MQHAKRVLNDDGAYEDPWPEHQQLYERAWASQDVIEAQVARAVVAGGSGERSRAEALAFINQADAPSCHACGSIMIRNGACYKCLTCGSTSGCS